MRYDEILSNVHRAVDELRAKGIIVKALDDALEELQGHAKNLASVEHGLEAIRAEVLSPIVRELEQNKRAGTASILGLYVGLASIVLSIALTVIPWIIQWSGQPQARGSGPQIQDAAERADAHTSDLARQVERLLIQLAGIPDSYVPKTGEIEAKKYGPPMVLLKSVDGELGIEVEGIQEQPSKGQGYVLVGFDVFLGARKLGERTVSQLFAIERTVSQRYIEDDRDALTFHHPSGQLWAAEGDFIVYRNNIKWRVARVFRRESSILPIADSKDAVLLIPSSGSGPSSKQ